MMGFPGRYIWICGWTHISCSLFLLLTSLEAKDVNKHKTPCYQNIYIEAQNPKLILINLEIIENRWKAIVTTIYTRSPYSLYFSATQERWLPGQPVQWRHVPGGWATWWTVHHTETECWWSARYCLQLHCRIGGHGRHHASSALYVAQRMKCVCLCHPTLHGFHTTLPTLPRSTLCYTASTTRSLVDAPVATAIALSPWQPKWK